jgi:hypothetical protein
MSVEMVDRVTRPRIAERFFGWVGTSRLRKLSRPFTRQFCHERRMPGSATPRSSAAKTAERDRLDAVAGTSNPESGVNCVAVDDTHRPEPIGVVARHFAVDEPSRSRVSSYARRGNSRAPLRAVRMLLLVMGSMPELRKTSTSHPVQARTLM